VQAWGLCEEGTGRALSGNGVGLKYAYFDPGFRVCDVRARHVRMLGSREEEGEVGCDDDLRVCRCV
jgi:hypothetical protein